VRRLIAPNLTFRGVQLLTLGIHRTAATRTTPTTAGTATRTAGTTAGTTRATPARTAPATGTTCEAIASTAVLATGTAGTTVAGAAVAGAARTAWTAGATSAARTTASAAISEVTRGRRELPADARTRHLAASRTIIFLLVFLRRAHLEAAEPARLVAIAAATESAAATATAAARTTAATRTTAALAATTALATTSAITAVIATGACSGDAIDHVMKLAARDRAVRTFLALEHANEANLVDTIADDVERFDETRGAIGLNAER
jgi:hypothetical protein